MNRKRVGLIALVVGAVAAASRRFGARSHAHTGHDDLVVPHPRPSADPSPRAAAHVQAVTANAGTSADDLTAAATTGNAELSTPEVPTSELSTSELSTSELSTSELPTSELPTSEVPTSELPTSGLSAPEIDLAGGVDLPTMPSAGSRTEPPAIVIPGATTAPGVTPEPSVPLVPAAPEPGANQIADAVSGPPQSVAAATDASSAPESAAIAASNVGQVSPPAASHAATVPVGPAGAEQQSFYRAHRGWSIAGSIALGLVVVAIIAASVIRLPYYSLQPGAVYDTIERVEAPGELVSIPSGEIGFVTVSQTANISPWQWLDAKLDNSVTIRHEDEVRGDQTADELREADIRRMQVSKSSAVVVALQKLGFELIITPLGIEVAQVFDCTAADGTLGTGDLIVGVNGVDVRTGEELIEQLMGQTVGAEVELLVERIDPANPTQSLATDLVALTLGSADAPCLPDEVRADEPRPFIGIGTLPIFDEELPIEVDVRTGSVSGPSAGLAFTLAIMDVLSEGELTNGLNVVATGTIDRDGNVGPVGGIHQKTIAAERSGADVFLVPNCCDNFVSSDTGEPLDIPSNYEEALLYNEDMIVIGIDTLDEALIALGELGGDVEAFVEQTTS